MCCIAAGVHLLQTAVVGGDQGQVNQLFSDTSRGALVSPCGRLMSRKALMTAAKTQAHRDEDVLCIDQRSTTFFQVWLHR